MDVKCKSVQAYANGNLGIVTCEEVVMRASTLTCTNVFEKQGGEWRMIQHHASAVFPGSVAAGGVARRLHRRFLFFYIAFCCTSVKVPGSIV